jgi:nucleoside 2-deoxyribosyltransferase
MERVKIYLAGGMTGLTEEEQTKWRIYIINSIKENDGFTKLPDFFNPTYYYSPLNDNHKSEKEVMEYELDKLRHSDLVVVNFNSPNSIGTAMEVAVARENKIPILGVNIDNKCIHPWLTECCMRICETEDEVINYIIHYYLN